MSDNNTVDKAMVRLIPPFSYPASDWCFRIMTAWGAMQEGINYDAPEVSKILLPPILAALPVNLLRVATLSPFSELLEWLEEYDKPVVSLEDALSNQEIPVGTKPSIWYAQLFSKIQSAMPKGTAKRTIETLAWSTIRKNFSPHLKAAIILLDPLKVPDTSTWQRLDEAVSNPSLESRFVASTTTANIADSNLLLEKVNELEAQLAHLRNQI